MYRISGTRGKVKWFVHNVEQFFWTYTSGFQPILNVVRVQNVLNMQLGEGKISTEQCESRQFKKENRGISDVKTLFVISLTEPKISIMCWKICILLKRNKTRDPT